MKFDNPKSKLHHRYQSIINRCTGLVIYILLSGLCVSVDGYASAVFMPALVIFILLAGIACIGLLFFLIYWSCRAAYSFFIEGIEI
jgi:hypothetical protein